MATDTPSIYIDYAPIYDAIGQARFGTNMAQWAWDWLIQHDAPPLQVLDLACGTGAATLFFAEKGCNVVGIDQSPAMLEIARGKARDAGYTPTFIQGDIRQLASITLPTLYDVATCFYDSFNYLAEAGDLARVFAGLANILRPGGWLIFDLNTTAEFATWNERDTITYDGRDCLVYNRLSYDPTTRLATGRIVWFVREIDRWWRGEETHTERAWSPDEVGADLANAGFVSYAQLDILDAQLNVVESHPTTPSSRVIYIAQRG